MSTSYLFPDALLDQYSAAQCRCLSSQCCCEHCI